MGALATNLPKLHYSLRGSIFSKADNCLGKATEGTWPRKKETRPDLYTELVLSLLFAQNGSPVCFALPLYSLVRVAPVVRE